jgi:serine/threonine protein kinase/ribosomal protein L40E
MNDYMRICPVCNTEAAHDATQCANCGTLLLGVDLTLKQSAPVVAPAAPRPAPAAALRCSHADCGAENAPGSTHCLYCGRPLATEESAVLPAPTFYRLPAALADKFRIVEVLPAGGAEAEIMVLAGISSGVRVIAKLYRPGLLPKGEILERISRAAFRHVVHLIAWGESDGIGYEVMEYCPAGSLRHLMDNGPLPRDVLRDILVELADALAALHELDVIHRDLKPENILVRRHAPLDLVLTDFGIASVAAATQVFTGLARTVKYGAPETLTGVLDRAADWWSLGMILAELLAGHHPFDGLSDAVIAHRLVTGSVDLAAIDDPDWRKLCRGLLQRDPKRRWGNAEIRRWLDGDATLATPAETAGATTTSVHIPRPYRIEEIACGTPAELAVALATHWAAGIKDLTRGQLAGWIEKELRDDNLLRLVRDLAELRDASDDLRLLRLIRSLAPDMPPVWRGASLLVANLLAQAARAEQGDREAADWLISVLAQPVLRELPAARFPDEAALAARWDAARARFATLWQETDSLRTHWRTQQTSRDGVADFDALVFGQPTTPELPAPARLYPPLLLALVDTDFAARLRARIEAEAAPWVAHNPWLEQLLADHEAVNLVVALFLLPHARAAADDQQKRRQREIAAGAAQLAALTLRANQSLALLREACNLNLTAGALERDTALAAARALLTLVEEARAAGLTPDTPTVRALWRAEPLALRIQERLDEWMHAARINAVLRNRNIGQGILIGIPGLLFFVGPQFIALLPWAVAALAAVAGWRLWSLARIRAAIRSLAQGLPLRVPAAP